MARYINEATLVKAIVRERDKIPLRVPCAPYELLDKKPYAFGQAQRAGIRKALRCVSEAPTADVAPRREVAREIFEEIGEYASDFAAGYIDGDQFLQAIYNARAKYTNPVHCKDCQHLMFSDCYGECSKGHKGIVKPDDSCEYGVKKYKEETK